jgi:hypothetical protein
VAGSLSVRGWNWAKAVVAELANSVVRIAYRRIEERVNISRYISGKLLKIRRGEARQE